MLFVAGQPDLPWLLEIFICFPAFSFQDDPSNFTCFFPFRVQLGCFHVPGLGRLSSWLPPPMYCLSNKTDLLVQLVLTYTNTKTNILCFILYVSRVLGGFRPLWPKWYIQHIISVQKCDIFAIFSEQFPIQKWTSHWFNAVLFQELAMHNCSWDEKGQ